MSNDSVVILEGARTPMGGLQGDLAAVPATELAATAIAAALQRSGIDHAQVGSRLDDALESARRVISKCGPQDDVTIWVAGARPRVLVGPTRDRPPVATALRCSSTPPRPQDWCRSMSPLSAAIS